MDRFIISSSVIIDNFHIKNIIAFEAETNSPLCVDGNRVLPPSVSFDHELYVVCHVTVVNMMQIKNSPFLKLDFHRN